MQKIVSLVLEYWYLLIALIICWELIKLILKKLLKVVSFPFQKIIQLAFGNSKTLNIELAILLLLAIGYIVYTIWVGH